MERFDCTKMGAMQRVDWDGKWVRYDDHRAEIERLEKEVERLQSEAYKANRRADLADGWRDHDKERAEKAEKEVERLTVLLMKQDTARERNVWNDAIDAAVQAADDCRKSAFTAGMGMQPVLEAIRALKRSEE